MDKKKIIVDIDRLKYPNTGMYSFCYNLFKEFLKYKEIDFYFYKHKATILPEKANSIAIQFWDIFHIFNLRKFDLWHTTSQLAKRIPSSKIKFVYTVHDMNFMYSDKTNWKKNKLLNQIKGNIARADYITFISKFAANDLQKYIPITNKKYKVIYNGIRLNPCTDTFIPRIEPTGSFLFTLGVIDRKKNSHVILNLLQKKDLNLILSGITTDPKYHQYIIDEAKRLGVLDKIIFTGAISEEEKYWYLKHCTAFVFTSISEGFGLPPIEAMRLGKPVFLSNLTSLPEVGGSASYYFENFSPNHMNDVFDKGMKDYIDNDRKNSIIEWSNQFTWEKAAAEYILIYNELLH